MTHITCRLIAKNWDQLRNPKLCNRIWATFIFIIQLDTHTHMLNTYVCLRSCRPKFSISGQLQRYTFISQPQVITDTEMITKWKVTLQLHLNLSILILYHIITCLYSKLSTVPMSVQTCNNSHSGQFVKQSAPTDQSTVPTANKLWNK